MLAYAHPEAALGTESADQLVSLLQAPLPDMMFSVAEAFAEARSAHTSALLPLSHSHRLAAPFLPHNLWVRFYVQAAVKFGFKEATVTQVARACQVGSFLHAGSVLELLSAGCGTPTLPVDAVMEAKLRVLTNPVFQVTMDKLAEPRTCYDLQRAVVHEMLRASNR
ncbi:hypothetical protein EON66_06065 [archaeon]|nr:MAG: hypothetical protein EON66_06065 [archaeon]